MAFVYDIEVNLTADTAKKAKDILGSFAKQVSKNAITIQLDYNSDLGDLTKKLNQIQKECPALSVQVQYDFTEKMIEQARANLQKLYDSADYSKISDELKNAVAEYDKLLSDNASTKEIDNSVKKIAELTATLRDSTKGFDIYEKLPAEIKETVEDLEILNNKTEAIFERAKPRKIVDEKEIEKQVQYIAKLEQELAKLESQGVSSRQTTDITELKNTVDEINAIVSEKISIQADNSSAIQIIDQTKEYLETLPDEKTIKISGTNTVVEKMGAFVSEFKEITQQMETTFGGGVLSSKGKSNLEKSLKVIKDTREQEKALASSVKEMNQDLDKALNTTSGENLEQKIEALLKQVQVAKRGLKGISLNVDIADKEQVIQNLHEISRLIENIPSQKDVRINIVESGKNVANSLMYDESSLEKGFQQLQTYAAKYGDFSFRPLKGQTKADIEEVKNAFKSLLEQYEKYVNYGGTRPITDLTESSKAAAKLTAAYKEQTETVRKQEQETEQLQKQAQELQETQSVKIKVEPTLEPQEFANEVTSLLSDIQAYINVLPKVNDNSVESLSKLLSGASFDSSVGDFNSLNKLLNNLANNKDGRIDELLKTLTKIRNVFSKGLEQNSLGEALKDISAQAGGLKALSTLLKDFEKAKEVIQEAKAGIVDSNFSNSTIDWIQSIEKEYDLVGDKALEASQKVQTSLQKMRVEADGGNALDVWTAALEQLSVVENKIKDTDSVRLGKEIENVKQKILSLYSAGKNEVAQTPINTLQQMFNRFVQSVDNSEITFDEAKEHIANFKQALESINTVVKEQNKGVLFASSKSIDSLLKRMSSFIDSSLNPRLSSEKRNAVENLINQINIDAKNLTNDGLSEVENKFRSIYNEARKSNELGQGWFGGWQKRIVSLTQYLATFASFYRIVGYVRQSISTINELDYALIDLRKTTTMTNEELEKFYHNSSNVAKETGNTAKEIIEQAAAWSRLGYSSNEAATEMAELSSQFAAISPGMSLDTATDGLVSTMKAFHIDVENVEREVMDSINRIGNTMATSNEEVVEMLTRSSAAMSAANNTLAETVALESAAVQITRNAETTGTAFRTISMRIRGLDEETEEALEDFDMLQGEIADLTKTAKTPGGISLFTDKDKTTYKSTYQLLKEIAEIYHDLNDKQQAELLETLAGKRGGQVLAGLLDDFSEVERAMGEIEKSAGSADDEMEIVRQSITFQLNALKQTWIGFLQDLIDRGTIQKLLENLTELSERFIDLVENNPAVVAVGVAALLKSLKALVTGNVITNITQLVNSFSQLHKVGIGGVLLSKSGLLNLKDAINDFRLMGSAATTAADEIDDLVLSAWKSEGLISETGAGVSALGAGLSSLAPYIPILAGAVGLIYTAVKAWDYFNVTVDEVQENIDALESKISSLQSDIAELESIDYRNSAQQNRLEMLRNELSIQEQLLEIEKRRKIQEQVGTSFTDSFDKDNWNTTLSTYQARYATEQFTNEEGYGEQRHADRNEFLKTLDAQIQKYDELNQKLSEENQGTEDNIKLNKKRDELVQDMLNNSDNAYTEYANLAEKYKEMEEALLFLDYDNVADRPLINNIRTIMSEYEEEMNGLQEVIRETAKALGTYDYSSEIESVFSHAEFDGLRDKLLDLGKDGKLSVNMLTEQFPALIAVMKRAGVSAEELYYWLMNLADPLQGELYDFASKWQPTSSGTRGDFEQQQYSEIVNYLQDLKNRDPDAFKAVILAEVDWSTFDTAEEVKAKVQQIIGEASPVSIDLELSNIDDAVTGLNERLKPQFDELASVYNAIFNGDNGFTLKDVDNDMLKGIVDKFIDGATEVGIARDEAEKAANDFMRVLTTEGSTSEEVQQAFNDLATSYFYGAEGLKELNAETADAIEQQLKQMGITNADEIVDQIQFMQESINALSEITFEDIDFDAGLNALQDEYKKLEEEGFGDLANDFERGLMQSKFGNVDMDKRAIIEWSNKLKQTYEDELSSWDYNPSIGSIDTVYGGSDSFVLDNQEIEVAFTPLLVGENGESEGMLSQGTVTNYIQTLLDKADKAIEESGEEWSQDAVIKKAIELDLQGMDTDKIDAEGNKVGTVFVHGIVAAIGDNAIDVGELMHFSGEDGAFQLAQESIEVYNSLKEKLAEGSLTVENVTAEEIEILIREGAVAEETGQAIALMKIQKILVNENALNEETSINELIRLAGVAGVATDALVQLQRIQAQVGAVTASLEAAIASGSVSEIAHFQDALNKLNMQAEGLKTQIASDLENAVGVAYSSPASTSGAKSGGSSAGKEAGKSYIEAFDEELSKLKESYERGEMTLGEYLNAYKALIEKYFSNTEKYAEDRAKALHDFMSEMKGYYDSAISGVTTLLDHRISAVQKQKDAAIKAIEAEKTAALEGYQAQIDAIDSVIKEKNKQIKALEKEKKALDKRKKPLQDEIDAIQKANEERDRQFQLQKDLYELERLQNQRTQFIYKSGQMVYQTDPDAVRDQRSQVEKDEDDARIAELNKQIEAIEKQQDLLDEQIESLNEEIELLEEQKTSIQEIMDEVEKFYDDLIAQTEEYFDSLIEQLENTKSKWERLAEIDKIASAWKDVGGVMEMLGFTVDDVLNDVPGAFEAFEATYIATLGNLNGSNEQYIQGLADATGKSVDEIRTLMGSMEEFGTATKEPLEDTGKATEDLGNKAQTASTGVSNLASAASDLKESTEGTGEQISEINSNLDGIDGTKLDPLVTNLQEIASVLGGEDGTSGLIQALADLGSNTEILNPLIEQFNALTEAISGTVAALGGGTGVSQSEQSQTPTHPTATQSDSGESSGGAGLVGAIKAVKEAADKSIGAGGEEEGTVIGDFNALTESVNKVTSAIGGGGEVSDGEERNTPTHPQSGEGGGLISAIETLGETNTKVLTGGDNREGVISEWESFNAELGEAKEATSNILDSIKNLPEHKEVTIDVHLNVDGATEFTGTATRGKQKGHYTLNILDTIGIPDKFGDYSSKLRGKSGSANFGGTANLIGDWSYEGGSTLIGEIGPELVVFPNGTFRTFDYPQFVNLPRGSVIFNHLQTSEILDTKNQVHSITQKGKAHANGTANTLTPLSIADPEQYAKFNQTVEMLKTNTDAMSVSLNDIGYTTDDIARAVQNITNNNSNMANITFGDLHFTCNGITSADVMNEVGNALQREFSGLALNAYQRAMAH